MTRAKRIAIRNERIRLRKLKESESLDPTTTTTTTPIDPNRKLNLEIMIHCYKYQRRLTWMLSSILQQEGDIPNILINISHTDNDGEPTTEEVCKFFREKGLDIKETLVTQEDVKNRGKARNTQTKESQADYILYADCDMAYCKDFFDDLHRQLKTNLKNEKRLMGADRISLDIDFCSKYFEEDKRSYPCVIENVADIVNTWKIRWITGRRTCPGNFQLCSNAAIMEKGGGYGGRNRDVWRHTKSDRAMRCRLGGRVGIMVKKQWHLNHGRELGLQR